MYGVRWRPRDDLLIPNTKDTRRPAALVVPKIGQVWTMIQLRQTGSGEGNGRTTRPSVVVGTSRTQSCKHVRTSFGKQWLVSTLKVVIRGVLVDTSETANTPQSVKESADVWVQYGFRLSCSRFTVETLVEICEKSVTYEPTGDVFHGCLFQDFDYQVPKLAGVTRTRGSHGDTGNADTETFRLDGLALEVTLDKDDAATPRDDDDDDEDV